MDSRVEKNKAKTSKKDKIFGKEKSKYLRQKFQQVVIQALQKKGENDDNLEEEKEKILEFPQDIGITLNLSKMNLVEFPDELLDKMESVQYLYLEGSNLVSLPDNFFQKLSSLKWLDLRNNALTSLPIMGLKNHPTLEVILLQGNRIRYLPVELAMVPLLKGLQTTGNPLLNIPYDAIAQGFSGVMNHLKKLTSNNEISFPLSETISVKPASSQDEIMSNEIRNDNNEYNAQFWESDKLSKWRPFMRKKFRNTKTEYGNDNQNCNEQSSKIKSKITVTVRTYPKIPYKLKPFKCGTCNRNRNKAIALAQQNLKMRKTKLGYKRKAITMAAIEDKAKKEAYQAMMRESLEKQARKIQRMKDKDVLKSWRDHARLTKHQIKLLDNYQQYPSKDFANKTPFDVDPEFLSMLNRSDLYRSLKEYDNRSKRVKKPKIKITALDLERQMSEIVHKLKNLDTNDTDKPSTPRTSQSHMCNKMSKIVDIQKTLKQLQSLNSSMAGLTPISKLKKK